MPARKLAIITPNAWMLLPTTCANIRLHNTSWKKATAPANSISGSTQPAPGKALHTGVRGRAGGSGGGKDSEYPFGGGGGDTRLDSATASRNTMPLIAAPTQMVRDKPSSGSKAN